MADALICGRCAGYGDAWVAIGENCLNEIRLCESCAGTGVAKSLNHKPFAAFRDVMNAAIETIEVQEGKKNDHIT